MKKSLLEIQNEIINMYKDTIDFRIDNKDCAYCYVPEKIIYLNGKDLLYPTVESLFDLLHEIGHILTNTSKMKRCEEEFYATQWAITEIKKYGYTLSDKRKDEFQQYIWAWRETGIKHKAKNIPKKEQLILSW